MRLFLPLLAVCSPFFLELYVVEGDHEIVIIGVGNVDHCVVFHTDEVVGITLAVSDDEGRWAAFVVPPVARAGFLFTIH